MPRLATPPCLAALLAAAVVLIAPPALAQDSSAQERDRRIDPDTGRDVRVWPPDVLFDHLHLRLEMTIPDMTEPRFAAVQTLTVAPIGAARDRIELDAGSGLTISVVTVNGRPAPFEHNAEIARLTIWFPSAVPPGQTIALGLTYDAFKPGGNGAGLTWSRDDRRTPEFDPMLHAQGEPESNHLWFACHDFPNERLSTELIVTVPAPYQAVSNGELVRIVRNPAGPQPDAPPDQVVEADDGRPAPRQIPVRGTTTFHWRQDKPHTNYLVTLAVGRFDVVNVGGPDSAYPGLWMPVYGALGSGEAIRRAFASTPDMVAYFSDLFDYPFPWDKYAQILCRDFSAGAMENTSASTFNANLARTGRRGSLDEIIAHELVHQWFGDLVTCRSWEHLWLQEGWATMGEALWAERQNGSRGYQAAILGNMRAERARSSARYAPRHAAMVSNRYRRPDQRFMDGDNVYQKGGAVLHMLRERLGDDVFFAGSRLYLRRMQYDQGETDDFRLALEEASGQSLERFFDQWCKRPGHPSLEVAYRWTPESDGAQAGTLEIAVDQVQRIDADNPAYAIELPIYANLADESSDTADGRYLYVLSDSRTSAATFRLPRKPTSLSVDPRLTVLCRAEVRQPLEDSVTLLRSPPTLYAQLQAVDALARSSRPQAILALAAAWVESRFTMEPTSADRFMSAELAAALRSAAAHTHDRFAVLGRRTLAVITEEVNAVRTRLATTPRH